MQFASVILGRSSGQGQPADPGEYDDRLYSGLWGGAGISSTVESHGIRLRHPRVTGIITDLFPPKFSLPTNFQPLT